MGWFLDFSERWRSRFRRIRTTREEALLGEDIINVITRNILPTTEESESEVIRQRSKWGRFLQKMSEVDGVEVSDGNKVELLVGGEETVNSMLQAIENAEERVWIETYIFDDSLHVARKFVDALLDAKSRHCDVVVIMDYIGSLSFPWREELESAGIPVVLFNPFPWSHYVTSPTDLPIPKSVGPVPFRDHRKILIADSVGFCGSMNIQGENVVPPTPQNDSIYPGFFDLSAKLQGPCVAHLANVFRDSLEESKVGVLRGPIAVPPKAGSSYVQVLQSNIRKQRKSIQKVLATQIKSASKEVRVASSYFMPPGFLKRALLSSKTSTKIIASGTTDFTPIPGDLWAQTHALSRFQNRPKTTVSLYSKSHMHAKFTSVDSLFVCLGSYNFDRFSSRRNLESAIGVFDREVASQASAIHERLCVESVCAGVENYRLSKFLHWLAYLVMKTSGRNFFDGFDKAIDETAERRRCSLLRFARPEIVAVSFPIF